MTCALALIPLAGLANRSHRLSRWFLRFATGFPCSNQPYDFAVVTRQAAGSDDASALTAAISVFEGETSTGKRPDSRLMAFLADLETVGAGNEDKGWISVWPLTASAEGVALPTTTLPRSAPWYVPCLACGFASVGPPLHRGCSKGQQGPG
jgi:hypothetical protein